jgi:hypothetical protein
MLRIVRLAIVATTALVAWTFALSLDIQPSTRLFILLIPVVLAFAFALYLLVSLITGVLQFRTVPREAELLQKDINRAKKFLLTKGLSLE